MQTTLLALREVTRPPVTNERSNPRVSPADRPFRDALNDQHPLDDARPAARAESAPVESPRRDERARGRDEAAGADAHESRSDDAPDRDDAAVASDRAHTADARPNDRAASRDDADPSRNEPVANEASGGGVHGGTPEPAPVAPVEAQVSPRHAVNHAAPSTEAEATSANAGRAAQAVATEPHPFGPAPNRSSGGSAAASAHAQAATVAGTTDGSATAGSANASAAETSAAATNDPATGARTEAPPIALEGVGDERGAPHGGRGAASPVPVNDRATDATTANARDAVAPVTTTTNPPAPTPGTVSTSSVDAVSTTAVTAAPDRAPSDGDGSSSNADQNARRRGDAAPRPAQARAAQLEAQLRSEQLAPTDRPDGGSNAARPMARPVPLAPTAPAPTAMPEPPADTSNPARVVRGMAAMVNQRGGVMTMRLSPPAMGQLRIQMTMAQGSVTAQFTASTAEAHAMLEKSMPMLRSALESHGLHVERLGVHLNGPESSAQSRTDANGPQQQGQAQDGGARHDAAEGESRGRQDADTHRDGAPQRDARTAFAERLDAETFRAGFMDPGDRTAEQGDAA